MIEVLRANGRTKINMGGVWVTSDRINRDRFNDLRKQADKIRGEVEIFQELLAYALAQGKR